MSGTVPGTGVMTASVRIGSIIPAQLAYPAQPRILGMIAIFSLARMLSYLLRSGMSIQWLPNLVVSGSVASISGFVRPA